MIPGMNPQAMKQAMKKMGMKQEDIEASEVIIKTPGADLIIRNPQVTKIIMMGQESLQITGDIEELSSISEDDINTVAEQTGCSKEKAKEVLEEVDGDLAEAIIKLQGE
ncbi:MAG: nascent polypeptide-associated complex protein [Nanoarchaeota archaeon]|nr:nascent polypeptide-associated complex protein [Nanoarchaeota archaeon]